MKMIGSMTGVASSNDWHRLKATLPKTKDEAKAFAARMNAENASRVRVAVEVDTDEPTSGQQSAPAETPAEQQARMRRQKNAASWDRAFANARQSTAASWDRAFGKLGAAS